ncbi:phosphotransferase family protein [Pseudonocardia kunmingensis]|uniref:Aminoglycoside phosphotransferase (APT) family kinase protein n=1 Tax=Pseudonocardia kunmingensis TaxID=630975 RepID=A0A543DI35_9PSEU|nr:phosphotransferase family protein [Pseudonocardia kunmingensis]TQM09008.1 aminoglycoside phosphotransferase (APT) family kinase protein [Pseudonocardia kunmingensis]
MTGRDLPGLDLGRLRAHLDAERPGMVRGELRGHLVAGGRSNLTYEVGDGHSTWIVRRPPLGHVLATAHDMAREHRVITALRDTAVPVPRTFALCTDPDVIGAPFYVMEKVEGVPYRTADELARFGPDEVRAIALRLVDTLAELHAVDPAGVGLGDFGRPDGYLARQVKRWKQQLDASRSRDLAGADALHRRLAESVPEQQPAAIVHGDYRLDNVLVDDGQVRAVLDWEMATIGDPLADVGLLLVYQRRHELGGTFVGGVATASGFPSPQEVVARYAERSGRDLSRLGFYLALGYFKSAVICEGIHYRYQQGQTVGEGFDTVGRAVEPLLAAGLQSIDQGGRR